MQRSLFIITFYIKRIQDLLIPDRFPSVLVIEEVLLKSYSVLHTLNKITSPRTLSEHNEIHKSKFKAIQH